MKKLMVLLVLLVSTAVFAGVQVQNSSSAVLGTFEKIFCSTGVTCTVDAGRLKIVSSPTLVAPLTLENAEVIQNTTDDTVQVLSEDNNTTFQITGFEAKTANLNLYADQGDDSADKFSINVSTADVMAFKNNGTAFVSFDSSGNMTGNGANTISGFLRKQVATTSVSISIAQCGSSFVSDSADVMNLPEASTAIGCRLTFICNNTGDLDVNPDDADIILPTGALTPSTGDAIRCTDVGSGFVLEAVSASQWAVLSTNGTITDVN